MTSLVKLSLSGNNIKVRRGAIPLGLVRSAGNRTTLKTTIHILCLFCMSMKVEVRACTVKALICPWQHRIV